MSKEVKIDEEYFRTNGSECICSYCGGDFWHCDCHDPIEDLPEED